MKDILTADVVMTPNYALNEADFGDATVAPVWDFDKPDSVALFRNFQGKCCFVKPTFFDSDYVDLNMSCDATYGWIDNENNQDLGYTDVGAGTKFTLPARYGTIYRMVTKEAPLSATTIADSTSTQYKTSQDAQGNYVATLLYYVSEKDSIQIDVKEDIKLVSISASYPGSDNFMIWMPDTATVKNELLTLRKPEGAGSLLYDVSDLTVNGGLKVEAGEPLDSLSAQIEVPNELDENKYVSVSFKMAEGFSYLHGKCLIGMRIYGIKTSTKVQVVMSDTKGHKLESRLYEYNNLADSVLLDTLSNVKPDAVYMEGLVTMKIYVYGDADYYRLCMGIDSKGEVCEILRFPEGYTFTPHKAKSELDFDGLGLLTIDAHEVLGVNEDTERVILSSIEEVPMGDIILLHTDNAGATYHIPLTRADDAYVPENNKLRVSDGKVNGGPDIYRFSKEGDIYVFRNSSSTDILPNGEIYLKYHSAYKREVFYLSDADVPPKVPELVFKEMEDNRAQIEQYKGRTIKKVVFDGHKLYKNHMWNTICLPFDIISEAISETPLNGAVIYELDVADKSDYLTPTGYDAESGVATLNFKTAHVIEAGKPYFLEWETTTSSVIVNPEFANVTIKTTEAAEMAVTSNDGKVQFIGTYDPIVLTGNNASNLYVGTDDNIHVPTEHHEVGAFNGYFLVDLGNGLGIPGSNPLNKILLNIAGGDDVLRVITIIVPHNLQDDVWYDLQGRKYVDKPTQYGIYIMNGKKILLK